MIDSIAERKMIIESLIGSGLKEQVKQISRPATKAAADEQAVQWSPSPEPSALALPTTYQRPLLKPAPQAPVATEPVAPQFQPGSSMKGSWTPDGRLMSGNQQIGSFSPVHGTGGIEFEMGHIRGYTVSPTSGIAYNRQTGESFTFDLNLADGSFQIENIKANTAPKPAQVPDSKQLTWKGERTGETIDLGSGFTLSIKPDGTVDAVFPQPHETQNDSAAPGPAHDGISRGRGFIDRLGNLFLAFDNGATMRLSTQQDGTIFRILGYETLR